MKRWLGCLFVLVAAAGLLGAQVAQEDSAPPVPWSDDALLAAGTPPTPTGLTEVAYDPLANTAASTQPQKAGTCPCGCGCCEGKPCTCCKPAVKEKTSCDGRLTWHPCSDPRDRNLYLFRCDTQVGALNTRGQYRPYDADRDSWGPYSEPPIPIPSWAQAHQHPEQYQQSYLQGGCSSCGGGSCASGSCGFPMMLGGGSCGAGGCSGGGCGSGGCSGGRCGRRR